MPRWRFCGVLILLVAPVFGQETAPKKVNELLDGKLMYVGAMPGNLDQWIKDFLRRWGKYKLTGNPEGVDLVLKAVEPNESETEWEKRQGIPQPKGKGSRLPAPIPRRQKKDVPVVSIDVIDWVTSQRIWHAEILNRNQKKDEADPPPGPETTIYARGMSSDQLAMRVIRTLQAYVAELEKPGGPKSEVEKQTDH